MIPRKPSPEMVRAGQAAVSARPRPEAIEAIWIAMWDAASAGEAGTATDSEAGVAEGEHATAEGGDAQTQSGGEESVNGSPRE